jgi:hypothetical protein
VLVAHPVGRTFRRVNAAATNGATVPTMPMIADWALSGTGTPYATPSETSAVLTPVIVAAVNAGSCASPVGPLSGPVVGPGAAA